MRDGGGQQWGQRSKAQIPDAIRESLILSEIWRPPGCEALIAIFLHWNDAKRLVPNLEGFEYRQREARRPVSA
jgi:hypothetical protein